MILSIYILNHSNYSISYINILLLVTSMFSCTQYWPLNSTGERNVNLAILYSSISLALRKWKTINVANNARQLLPFHSLSTSSHIKLLSAHIPSSTLVSSRPSTSHTLTCQRARAFTVPHASYYFLTIIVQESHHWKLILNMSR